ncbi:uncharacterized protein LOC125945877 [Dermacentor silvarum]|uniref:uncharacterized protein LOC125945877 n=1 Tax=Dermacentor silvarum TaxID=543639 RepID=UPI0021011A3A|nr:uncharacterized protein LOC125945877 [Dermacentor silvarum]
MSSDLRERLHNVLKPPESRVVRVTVGRTPAMLGMCTTRVSVAGHHTSGFHVLSHCPHGVILGLDFLTDHLAVIDCSAGVVEFDFPASPDVPDTVQSQLSCAEFVRLPPQALTYIVVVPCPSVRDGDYVVILTTSVLSPHNISFPHTAVTGAANQTWLPFLNFTLSPQVLPQGIVLVTLLQSDECHISLLSPDFTSAILSTDAHTSPSVTSDITNIIVPDLLPSQVHDLRHLLVTYSHIFDFDGRPLGQTSLVKHLIHTGDAPPIHRRPYVVSPSEHQAIQQEVDKMLSKGITQPPASPWASPVVSLKKDNSWRFCVDYQHLNKITKKHSICH